MSVIIAQVLCIPSTFEKGTHLKINTMKSLSDEQLYALIKNETVDSNTTEKIRHELKARNLSKERIEELVKNTPSVHQPELLSLRERIITVLIPFNILFPLIVVWQNVWVNKDHKNKQLNKVNHYWKYAGIGAALWFVVLLVFTC